MSNTRCNRKGFPTEGAARHALRHAQTTTRRTSFNDASVYHCEARECQYKPFHIGHDWTGVRTKHVARRRDEMIEDLDEVFATQTARVRETLWGPRYAAPTSQEADEAVMATMELERRK